MIKNLIQRWRQWWHCHHPALKRFDLEPNTPGYGAPRCPVCDGLIGKCNHE